MFSKVAILSILVVFVTVQATTDVDIADVELDRSSVKPICPCFCYPKRLAGKAIHECRKHIYRKKCVVSSCALRHGRRGTWCCLPPPTPTPSSTPTPSKTPTPTPSKSPSPSPIKGCPCKCRAFKLGLIAARKECAHPARPARCVVGLCKGKRRPAKFQCCENDDSPPDSPTPTPSPVKCPCKCFTGRGGKRLAIHDCKRPHIPAACRIKHCIKHRKRGFYCCDH